MALGTLGYLSLAISGTIKSPNRLTAPEFGLIVAAAVMVGLVLRPDVLDRLQKLDAWGIKFELLEERQKEQNKLLDDVRFALTLLLEPNERKHLLSLFKNTTTAYNGRGTLKPEIRRLRTLRLVSMRGNKSVGNMPEKDFDLSEFVQLTEDGRKYAARLTEFADSPE